MYEVIDERYVEVPLARKKENIYFCNRNTILEVIVPYTVETDNIKVVLELSKNAMIGFGTALIRLYYKEFPEKMDIRTEPLESGGGGNQPLGFWLTSDSTSLYIYHKEFEVNNNKILGKHKNQISSYQSQINLSYLIDLEWDNDYMESYMLGFSNIAQLKIYNNGKEITKEKEVIINFNNVALLEVGVELIRRAHGYKENTVYEDMLGLKFINSNIKFIVKACEFPNIKVI